MENKLAIAGECAPIAVDAYGCLIFDVLETCARLVENYLLVQTQQINDLEDIFFMGFCCHFAEKSKIFNYPDPFSFRSLGRTYHTEVGIVQQTRFGCF